MGNCCSSKPSCGSSEKPVKEESQCQTDKKSDEKDTDKSGCCATK